MAFSRKTAWLIFAIYAPRLLLAEGFAHQGFSKSCDQVKNHSAKNRLGGKRINNLIGNFKNEEVSPLFDGHLIDATTESIEYSDYSQYAPPEWNALTTEAKVKLTDLLSWDNLSKWEFNIVEVADLTDDPLLLVGWALLCEPMAQEAMKRSLDLSVNGDLRVDLDDEDNTYHYHFYEHVKINPRTICNFLREVERRYVRENPYHNNIHAADVAQTTHCLFQLMDEQYLRCIYDPIAIFSLILAATFHDVCHPGTNNLFQQSAKTPLAIEYNNVSILENMHSAVGNSFLFGQERKDEWDVFEGWTHDEKTYARKIMRKSILATDMSNHFRLLKDMDSLIGELSTLAEDISEGNTNAETGGSQSQSILSILAQTLDVTDEPQACREDGCPAQSKLVIEFADLMIRFLLHMADISNSAKTNDLAIYWGNRVLSEFFAQGDKEKEMGYPISPLCDRDNVEVPDSQIDFIKYIIQPSFELLGRIIPRVNEEVAPGLGNNMEYWKQEKLRLSSIGIEESPISIH